MKTVLRAATLTLSLLGSFTAQAQPLPADVAQALDWMPPRSETLAVARGPLTLPILTSKGAPARPLAKALKVSPYFGVSNLQLGAVVFNLQGRTIELSLEARSNFRPPASLGLMLYDGCGLLQLRPAEGETALSLGKKLARGATRQAIIANQKVSIFEQKRVNDLWRVYVAVPRANCVLLATTRAQLETVLGRMNEKTVGPRAFPTEWSGWKLVNTSASFWAVRRLDLPESHGILGSPDKDLRAIACGAETTGPDASSLLMKILSPNRTVGQKMFNGMKGDLQGGATYRFVPPDLSVISVSGKKTNMASFYLLGFLGTAIFV